MTSRISFAIIRNLFLDKQTNKQTDKPLSTLTVLYPYEQGPEEEKGREKNAKISLPILMNIQPGVFEDFFPNVLMIGKLAIIRIFLTVHKYQKNI